MTGPVGWVRGDPQAPRAPRAIQFTPSSSVKATLQHACQATVAANSELRCSTVSSCIQPCETPVDNRPRLKDNRAGVCFSHDEEFHLVSVTRITELQQDHKYYDGVHGRQKEGTHSAPTPQGLSPETHNVQLVDAPPNRRRALVRHAQHHLSTRSNLSFRALCSRRIHRRASAKIKGLHGFVQASTSYR